MNPGIILSARMRRKGYTATYLAAHKNYEQDQNLMILTLGRLVGFA